VTPGAPRRVGAVVAAVATVGVCGLATAPPAGAVVTPVVAHQIFVQRDEVDPLVVRYQPGSLRLTSPGEATVGTGTGEVLVAVDLSFADDDRDAGVLLADGPAGDLRVMVERDGTDERVGVYLDDDEGGTTTLASAAAAAPGLPASAALRVEQHSGRMSVWLDGALVVDRGLTAPEVVLMTQNDHGVVVEHAGDQVSDAWVLARA
jgi:hypothetical protein